jgi:superfamily II RNA helicase
MSTEAYLRIVREDEEMPAKPSILALDTGYEPDRFQRFAIEAIERGDNVLVTAKTGSGKTFVGEYQIAKSLGRGGRVFYTTPIKSLSNQKFHDLKKLFPQATVGIMTGDIKFCPDADILVMTTEILRNLLFKKGTATEKVGATALISLDRLDAVVFDEVHYINDIDRGHVWEETLMLLDPSIKLILLSATLTKPEIFAGWLANSKQKPLWLITTQWRAVPLEHYVRGYDGKLRCMYDKREQFQSEIYREWLHERSAGLLAHDKYKEKVKDARRQGIEGPISGKTRPKSFEYELNECLNDLHTKGDLPAIIFQFSRKGCERLAGLTSGDFIDSSDAAAVRHIWDFHLSRYKESLEKSPQMHSLRELVQRGIAYHHSGLLPFLKEILEILFSKGYIKVLYATETFAVGINMPTKTVLFTALEKYTDGSIRPLTTAEYIQMAGRAGRRGKDTRGIVIYLPQREPMDLHEIRPLLCGSVSSFSSRLQFHYDFVLKLLLSKRGASELVEDSYWWALEKEAVKEMEKERKLLEDQKQETLLTQDQKKDFEDLEEIVERTSSQKQNVRKKAIRELENWKEEHDSAEWKIALKKYEKSKELEREIQELERCVERRSRLEVPMVHERIQVLVEYGYVKEEGPYWELTERGKLGSEIHEGHPFLMTEFFLRVKDNSAISQEEILGILSLFAGEDQRSENENNKPVDELHVSREVREELKQIYDDMKHFTEKERWQDPNYWNLSTECVELTMEWLENTEHTIGSLAAKYGMFEGNVQKILLKLSGLVEELEALGVLSGAVGFLKKMEGTREKLLRGIVIAESLYLRL